MKVRKRARQVFELLEQQGSPEKGLQTLLVLLSAIITAGADSKDEAIQCALEFGSGLVDDVMEEWDRGVPVKEGFKLKVVPGTRQ